MSNVDSWAESVGLCTSHCEHGGTCMLELNHAGQHDSHFCLWDDNQAISKREADKILAEKTGGREVLALEDLIFGGDSDPED